VLAISISRRAEPLKKSDLQVWSGNIRFWQVDCGMVISINHTRTPLAVAIILNRVKMLQKHVNNDLADKT
jgi:hypothetical protein